MKKTHFISSSVYFSNVPRKFCRFQNQNQFQLFFHHNRNLVNFSTAAASMKNNNNNSSSGSSSSTNRSINSSSSSNSNSSGNSKNTNRSSINSSNNINSNENCSPVPMDFDNYKRAFSSLRFYELVRNGLLLFIFRIPGTSKIKIKIINNKN